MVLYGIIYTVVRQKGEMQNDMSVSEQRMYRATMHDVAERAVFYPVTGKTLHQPSGRHTE